MIILVYIKKSEKCKQKVQILKYIKLALNYLSLLLTGSELMHVLWSALINVGYYSAISLFYFALLYGVAANCTERILFSFLLIYLFIS